MQQGQEAVAKNKNGELSMFRFHTRLVNVCRCACCSCQDAVGQLSPPPPGSPVGKEADGPLAVAVLHVAAQLGAVPAGVQPILHKGSSTHTHRVHSRLVCEVGDVGSLSTPDGHCLALTATGTGRTKWLAGGDPAAAHLKQGVAVGAVISARAGAALQQYNARQAYGSVTGGHALHPAPPGAAASSQNIQSSSPAWWPRKGLPGSCRCAGPYAVPFHCGGERQERGKCVWDYSAGLDHPIRRAVCFVLRLPLHLAAAPAAAWLEHPLISGSDQVATLAGHPQACTLSNAHLGWL